MTFNRKTICHVQRCQRSANGEVKIQHSSEGPEVLRSLILQWYNFQASFLTVSPKDIWQKLVSTSEQKTFLWWRLFMALFGQNPLAAFPLRTGITFALYLAIYTQAHTCMHTTLLYCIYTCRWPKLWIYFPSLILCLGQSLICISQKK